MTRAVIYGKSSKILSKIVPNCKIDHRNPLLERFPAPLFRGTVPAERILEKMERWKEERAELKKRYGRRGEAIGMFWDEIALAATDWHWSSRHPRLVEDYLKDFAIRFQTRARELRKKGDKEWRKSARKEVIKSELENIGEIELSGFWGSFLGRDFIDHLRKGKLNEFRKKLESILEKRPKEDTKYRANREMASFLLELADKEDPIKYLADNPEQWRKFIRLFFTRTEGGALPYQIMTILKEPEDKEGFRDTFKAVGWGYIKQELDKSLLGAVVMVPERTFVRETMQKLREFYDQGKKDEVLFPLFDARLKPIWPQDKEVLERIKAELEEIRESFKKDRDKEEVEP